LVAVELSNKLFNEIKRKELAFSWEKKGIEKRDCLAESDVC
jgi:hypothetical protein